MEVNKMKEELEQCKSEIKKYQKDRDKNNIITMQIEHIINYEHDFYNNIDELINDLEKILKGKIIFEEVFK